MPDVAKTTTAEALLGLLTLKPMSGYELRQMISDSIGNFWSESFGQIYPTLKRLEAEGLVHGAEGDRPGSTRYQLTPAGRDRLAAWLAVMPRPSVPRNEALLKLFFGNHAPIETMVRQVEAQRDQALSDLARYHAIAEQLEQQRISNPGRPFWLMTVRYGLAEARAHLAWCDESLEALTATPDLHPKDTAHAAP